MVGLLVITHGNIAHELLRAAELILGSFPHSRALAVQRGDNAEEIGASIGQAVQELNVDGDGVMVMTDMFGGTPTNLVARYLTDQPIEIITGVSLPMILKFAGNRSRSLQQLVPAVVESGQKGIISVGDLLRKQTDL